MKEKNKVHGLVFFIRTTDDVTPETVYESTRKEKLFGLMPEEMCLTILDERSFVPNPETMEAGEKMKIILDTLRDSIIQNKKDKSVNIPEIIEIENENDEGEEDE